MVQSRKYSYLFALALLTCGTPQRAQAGFGEFATGTLMTIAMTPSFIVGTVGLACVGLGATAYAGYKTVSSLVGGNKDQRTLNAIAKRYERVHAQHARLVSPLDRVNDMVWELDNTDEVINNIPAKTREAISNELRTIKAMRPFKTKLDKSINELAVIQKDLEAHLDNLLHRRSRTRSVSGVIKEAKELAIDIDILAKQLEVIEELVTQHEQANRPTKRYSRRYAV